MARVKLSQSITAQSTSALAPSGTAEVSRRRGLSLPSCQPDCSLISSRMCCLSCLGRVLSLQICRRTQTAGRAMHQSPCVTWAGRSNLPATMYIGLKYGQQGRSMQKQHKSMQGERVAIYKKREINDSQCII